MPANNLIASAAFVLAILLTSGCATKQRSKAEFPDTHWTYSRFVQTDNSLITLFDPADIAHHAVEPAGWYFYDFAFAKDLETGRFASVLTSQNGSFNVRVTSQQLTARERSAAGPHATLRLRVINGRLLLAGGNAWPSVENNRSADPYDSRWLNVPNGDYELTITVLDNPSGSLHDYVFQLLRVKSISEVSFAPGIPQLLIGQARGVAGLNAPGWNFSERCGEVPRQAEWSVLSGGHLPLPGTYKDVTVSDYFYNRAHKLEMAGQGAFIPIVVSRIPTVGVIGVFLKPTNWLYTPSDDPQQPVTQGRVLCAVRITAVSPTSDTFFLEIEPLPTQRGDLPTELKQKLIDRFKTWARLSGDPAWKFHGELAHRAVNDRSLVLGIMQYRKLTPKAVEHLLTLNNKKRALQMIENLLLP